MMKTILVALSLAMLSACVVRPARPRPATVVVVKRCAIGHHWNGNRCVRN